MTCPIPGAQSWSDPEGTGANGVMILGEALGESEAKDHLPFRPYAEAGAVLERAIKRCGFTRQQFVLTNVVPVRPPNNWLAGAPYESEAIEWGKEILVEVVKKYRPRCVLALGNIPLRASTGLAGDKLSVTHLRGWPLPALSQFGNVPVVSTFHPSFLRRGAMALFSVLMHDLKLSVAVANSKVGQSVRFFSPVLSRDMEYAHHDLVDITNPVIPPGYITMPQHSQAIEFLEEAASDPTQPIAYDIETPRSTEATETDSDELPDRDIVSIQFSTRPRTGIFMPWRDPFIEVARAILALPNPKIGANSWRFDDPILTAHGAHLNGERHDLRWAFHHLQPDLKGALQFIASFYNSGDGYPWKHLHNSHVAAYGILDVDWCQRIIANEDKGIPSL